MCDLFRSWAVLVVTTITIEGGWRDEMEGGIIGMRGKGVEDVKNTYFKSECS
jgi:hypothetical protein